MLDVDIASGKGKCRGKCNRAATASKGAGGNIGGTMVEVLKSFRQIPIRASSPLDYPMFPIWAPVNSSVASDMGVS